VNLPAYKAGLVGHVPIKGEGGKGIKQITLRYLSSIISNIYIELYKKDSRIVKGVPVSPFPTSRDYSL